MKTSLTKEDLVAIETLIASIPNIDTRILEIHAMSRGKVEVMTGELPDPEAGHGNSVVVERKEGKWVQSGPIGNWIA